MKIKCTIIITLIATAAIVTFLLVYHASHSTDEMVRRRAVIAYYHFMRCSAERREAARYLLDNMPYHYGYGTMERNDEQRNMARRIIDKAVKVPSLRITEIKDEMRYILEETDYQ